MNSLCKTATLVLGIALAALSTPSSAVPFGNSVSGNVYVPGCTSVTLASIPVTIDVTSTIYATVSGVAQNPDGTYPQNFSYQITLRDANDTTTLASSTGNSIFILNNQSSSFNDSQVLAGSGSSYAATPGIYLLKVVLTGGYVCSGTMSVKVNGELTYILLSSVLDRVFANGFSMIDAFDPMASMT